MFCGLLTIMLSIQDSEQLGLACVATETVGVNPLQSITSSKHELLLFSWNILILKSLMITVSCLLLDTVSSIPAMHFKKLEIFPLGVLYITPTVAVYC